MKRYGQFIGLAGIASLLMVASPRYAIITTIGPTVNLVLNSSDCLNANTVHTPYVFNTLTINNGVTLSLCDMVTSTDKGLYIKVNSYVLIQSLGVIDLSKKSNIAAAFETVECAPQWLLDAGWQNGVYNHTADGPGRLNGYPGANGNVPLSPKPGSNNLTLGHWRLGTSGGTDPVNGSYRGGDGGFGGRMMCEGRVGGDGGPHAGITGGTGGKGGGLLFIEADRFFHYGVITTRAEGGSTGNQVYNSTPGGCGGNPVRACSQNVNPWGASYFGGGGGGGGGGGPVIIKSKYIFTDIRSVIDTQGGMGGNGGAEGHTASSSWSTSGRSNWLGGRGGRGYDGSVVFIYSTSNPATDFAIKQPPQADNSFNILTKTPNPALAATRFAIFDVPDISGPVIDGLNFDSIFKPNQKAGIWINLNGLTAIDNPPWSTETLLGTPTLKYWIKLYGARINSFNIVDYVKKFPIDEVWFQFGDGSFNKKVYFCLEGTECNDTSISSALRPDVYGRYKATSTDRTYDVTDVNYDFNWFNDWYNSSPTGGTGMIYGSTKLPFFTLPDGVNYIKVYARTRGDRQSEREEAIFIDQYAPCDNIYHLCFVRILDQSNQDMELIMPGLTVSTAFMNNTNFKLKLTLIEAQGSGLESKPAAPNIKVAVAVQSGVLLQTRRSDTTIVNLETGANFDPLLKDKSCNELLGPGGAWNNNASSFHDFSYDFDLVSQSFLINAAAGGVNGGAPLKADMDALLASLGQGGDGTVYFIVCTQDKAGNSSRIIDKTDTNFFYNFSNIVPLTYYGPDRPITIADYDVSQSDRNHSTFKTQAYLPQLLKRLYIDSPSKDDPETPLPPCSFVSDPCMADILAPVPAFINSSNDISPRVAFNPPGFTNGSKIEVGVKLPFDRSGIRKVYYYIGSSPPTQLEAIQVTLPISCSNLITANNQYDNGNRTTGWVDYCFAVQATTGNSIYVWFEDNAGNIANGSAYAARTLFVDNTPPLPPLTLGLGITPNPSTSLTPLFRFDRAQNDTIDQYIACYWTSIPELTYGVLVSMQTNDLSVICPDSSVLFGAPGYKLEGIPNNPLVVQQTFTMPQFPTLSFGRWDVAIFAKDTAGNISAPSLIHTMVLSDGKSFLDFTQENEDYTAGGISPRTGSQGMYTFRVKYTDLDNNPPNIAKVFIDLDGDDQYQPLEEFTMVKDLTAKNPSQRNDLFYDGEQYTLSIELKYLKHVEGKIKYRFFFENNIAGSVDGKKEGNPVADNTISLDPYDVNSFRGMMQVRNNVYKPGAKRFPVIIVKEPYTANKEVTIGIYNNSGVLVKDIVKGKPYRSIDRYVIWDLTDRAGQKVGSGLYTVVYQFDNGEIETSKVVVLR